MADNLVGLAEEYRRDEVKTAGEYRALAQRLREMADRERSHELYVYSVLVEHAARDEASHAQLFENLRAFLTARGVRV